MLWGGIFESKHMITMKRSKRISIRNRTRHCLTICDTHTQGVLLHITACPSETTATVVIHRRLERSTSSMTRISKANGAYLMQVVSFGDILRAINHAVTQANHNLLHRTLQSSCACDHIRSSKIKYAKRIQSTDTRVCVFASFSVQSSAVTPTYTSRCLWIYTDPQTGTNVEKLVVKGRN
jgi:hypothetical protein